MTHSSPADKMAVRDVSRGNLVDGCVRVDRAERTLPQRSSAYLPQRSPGHRGGCRGSPLIAWPDLGDSPQSALGVDRCEGRLDERIDRPTSLLRVVGREQVLHCLARLVARHEPEERDGLLDQLVLSLLVVVDRLLFRDPVREQPVGNAPDLELVNPLRPPQRLTPSYQSRV